MPHPGRNYPYRIPRLITPALSSQSHVVSKHPCHERSHGGTPVEADAQLVFACRSIPPYSGISVSSSGYAVKVLSPIPSDGSARLKSLLYDHQECMPQGWGQSVTPMRRAWMKAFITKYI